MRLVAVGIFVLSGAAGLFYESVWARYLGLFVGHTAYAQVVVLAIFLGSMAVGALAVGARTDRIRDPLRVYAYVEAVVGLLGLVFHDVFRFVTEWMYTIAFPALGTGWTVTLMKWSTACLLLVPQSVLLGMTFPLMVAGTIRRLRRQPGETIALLYFANGLGAAVGVLVAGFYLLSAVGLPGTVLAAAMLNLIVAVSALTLATRVPILEGAPAAPAAPATPAPPELPPESLRLLLLTVSFGTAAASFFYEIGWLRMLSLVLGAATHAFELMLSAFILGLAVGAWWVRRRADRWIHPVRVLAVVQVCMGVAALATLPLYAFSFDWIAGLLDTLAQTDSGYRAFNLARYTICLVIMFPATFCAGMTLPIITRTLLVSGAGEGAIGAVYGVNTAGAIVGTGLASLIAMPWLGMRGVLVAGATADLVLGLAILAVLVRYRRFPRRVAQGLLAGAAALVLLVGLGDGVEQEVLYSGVFRHGAIRSDSSTESLYYADGRTATVAAYRSIQGKSITIATNGKPDGSLPASWLESCSDTTTAAVVGGDTSTQMLLALFSAAHVRAPRLAAVIGHGTGMSSHFLLGDPRFEEVRTIEIEPEMVRGSRAFYPANERVFDDPRSTIIIDDAKTHFAAAGARFDLILSEPSNPWVSGVASLFTEEFYEHVKRYLTPDGVFGQWLHLYESNDLLILNVLAAIHRVFGSYELYSTSAADFVVIATPSERPLVPDWSVADFPVYTDERCHIQPVRPRHLDAAHLVGRSVLAPLVGDWPANSDFYPVLEIGAERARFVRRVAFGFADLASERFNMAAALAGRRVGPFPDAQVGFSLSRLRALAQGALIRNPSADTTGLSEAQHRALYRAHQWDLTVARTGPPPDWQTWTEHFRRSEHDRLAGTGGMSDPAFYTAVDRYLTRTTPPPIVRHVIAFYAAMAAWDDIAVTEAAIALRDASESWTRWIEPNLLIEGTVSAFLRRGDFEEARRFFASEQNVYSRPASDLRRLLVQAFLRDDGSP